MGGLWSWMRVESCLAELGVDLAVRYHAADRRRTHKNKHVVRASRALEDGSGTHNL